MIVATFRAGTPSVGQTIEYEDGVFAFAGGVELTADQVLAHDRAGQIDWAYDGLREWVGSLTATQAEPEMGDSEPGEDPIVKTDWVGHSIRQIAKSGALAVGAAAGLLAWFGSAVILFLVGLLPTFAAEGPFGSRFTPDESVSSAVRVMRAALSGWGGQTSWVSGSDSGDWSSILLGGLVVTAVSLGLAGLMVRRLVAPRLALRITALASAAVTLAFIVLVLAAVLTYQIPAGDWEGATPTRYSYDAFAYGVSAMLITLAVGAFTFGVVRLLPKAVSSALIRAALYVAVVFLAGAVLFPVFVVSDNLKGASHGDDFGLACLTSPAVSGASIPLALSAKANFDGKAHSPFWSNSESADSAHWPRLNGYLNDHPQARLLSYGRVGGAMGALAAIGLSVLVVISLLGLVVSLCRRLRPGTAVSGLWLGLLQGSCVVGFLLPLSYLTRLTITWEYSGDAGGGYWGVSWGNFFYAAAILIAICGVTGLVFAALRPGGARQAAIGPATVQAHAMPFVGVTAPSEGSATPDNVQPAKAPAVGATAPAIGQPAVPSAPMSAADQTIERRLTKLSQLHAEGLVTPEEYEAKRAALLAEL